MLLKNLLAKSRAYHPSYQGGLCNHCPMTIIALDRMGATPKRVQSYAIPTLRKMELAPPPGDAINAENWKDRLGEEAAYADYLGFSRRGSDGSMHGRPCAHTCRNWRPASAPRPSMRPFAPPMG